jgi:hypothetical protein
MNPQQAGWGDLWQAGLPLPGTRASHARLPAGVSRAYRLAALRCRMGGAGWLADLPACLSACAPPLRRGPASVAPRQGKAPSGRPAAGKQPYEIAAV